MTTSTAAGWQKDFVCLENNVSGVPFLNYTHGRILQTCRATTDELVKREQAGQSWAAVHLMLQGWTPEECVYKQLLAATSYRHSDCWCVEARGWIPIALITGGSWCRIKAWYYSEDAKGSWFRLLVEVFVMAHNQHLIFIYSDYYKEWTLKWSEEKKGHNTKWN